MKKADLILIAAVMIMAAVIFFICKISNLDYSENNVIVRYNGEIYGQYVLYINNEYDIKTELGYNKLVVSDNKCYVLESDCENKICINTGAIKETGEVICCLPHQLVIYVE